MRTRDFIELVVLGALWGASFLFMRVAAPEFGPVALIAVRVVVAAVFLATVLAATHRWGGLRGNVAHLIAVGVVNSALPFCLFAYATLSVTAGYAAILNATAPLWGASVAFLWLHDRLPPVRIVGLLIGFAGALMLVWDSAALKPGGTAMAVAAGLVGALSYGIGANYTKRFLPTADPLAIATGSQIAAALLLLLPGAYAWPVRTPSATAWGCAIVLAVASTGIAYMLYFRLIARAGPARAIAVTFLIPVFAALFGYLWLSEPVTLRMVIGGATVLLGTSLSTGVLGAGSRFAARGPA